ncbi:MAG: serine hydrolase domain-containing protein [Pyrinomonadaceae bacterium]
MIDEISTYLQQRIDVGDFPSAVYLVAERGEIVFQDALGHAVVEPERIPAKIDTIYDLASLTKPLVTCLLTARLLENSILGIEDNVRNFLGDTRGSATAIKSLVTHTSGFPGWKPFYLMRDAPAFDADDYGAAGENNDEIKQFVKREILRTPRVSDTARNVIYSDLNFLLLGFLVEQIVGRDLRSVAESDIFYRLGLKSTSFCGPGSSKYDCAASEHGNGYEKQTCMELGYLTSPGGASEISDPRSGFREQIIWGEVHDGNAWFMGGVAGHAGLFSTAEETFKIALQFLPGYTKLLKPETCELFRTNFTPGMNEHRSFAFQLASTPESTAGTTMSPQSFGHLGFTGTSLWIDPEKERVFILLTNRTHAHPLPFVNINGVRRHFHDLAIDLLDQK